MFTQKPKYVTINLCVCVAHSIFGCGAVVMNLEYFFRNRGSLQRKVVAGGLAAVF